MKEVFKEKLFAQKEKERVKQGKKYKKTKTKALYKIKEVGHLAVM